MPQLGRRGKDRAGIKVAKQLLTNRMGFQLRIMGPAKDHGDVFLFSICFLLDSCRESRLMGISGIAAGGSPAVKIQRQDLCVSKNWLDLCLI